MESDGCGNAAEGGLWCAHSHSRRAFYTRWSGRICHPTVQQKVGTANAPKRMRTKRRSRSAAKNNAVPANNDLQEQGGCTTRKGKLEGTCVITCYHGFAQEGVIGLSSPRLYDMQYSRPSRKAKTPNFAVQSSFASDSTSTFGLTQNTVRRNEYN